MRMRRIALFTCRLWLMLTVCAAQADEVVVTLGGDCVLGTREEWKNDAETFDTMIAEKGEKIAFKELKAYIKDERKREKAETKAKIKQYNSENK